MGSAKSRVQTVASLAGFYATRPSRLGDLKRWANDRGQGTLELRLPWWNYAALEVISGALPPQPKVFEYGGGGSTLWLADRGAESVTVEHESEWSEILKAELPATCRVLYRPGTASGNASSESTPNVFYDDYVNAIDDWPDMSFDFVIVDGRARVDCVRAARSKVKPGGILLLDDSDRPRYAQAAALLDGWAREDYKGAKPSGGGVVQSSVWVRPN